MNCTFGLVTRPSYRPAFIWAKLPVAPESTMVMIVVVG